MALKIWVLRDATAAVLDQIFEDAALAPRQQEGLAADLGVAPVEEDADLADRDVVLLGGAGGDAAADGVDAGQELADMDGLAHHVVEARREEVQRLFERLGLVDGDDRARRSARGSSRDSRPVAAIADQEGFDGLQVVVRHGLDPAPEVGRAEAGASRRLRT